METIKDVDLISIQETRDLVEKAYEAQKGFEKLDQEKTNNVVNSLARVLYENSEYLAKLACETTKFGRWEDKKTKNILASEILNDYMKNIKTRGIINEDKDNKIYEVAVPMGVVAGIIPTTNPTSTVIFKTLISLKAGNAIVFSPHPRALECILKTVEIIKSELKRLGIDDNLVGCISNPTMVATSELMKHDKVAIILATGGSAMVKSAYSSGKPALGVGPGNVPAYIDKTANVEKAVADILCSKTFDNGTICASEQSIIAHSAVSDLVKKECIRQGAYILNEEEKKKVEKILVGPTGAFNPNIVGLDGKTLADMAGIKVPDYTRVLIAPETGVGKKFPFSIEKLTCILAFYEAKNLDDAKYIALSLIRFGGMGHSCAIHANDKERILNYSSVMPVSRVLVNTPTSQGAVGYATSLTPSFTLGCGSYGGNATSDNISVLHLFNRKRIAYGVNDISKIKDFSNGSSNNSVNNIYNDEFINKIIIEVKKALNNKI